MTDHWADKTEVHLRSTSLKNFMACARLYEYTSIPGLTPPTNIHLTFGKHFASALELWMKGGKVEDIVKWLLKQEITMDLSTEKNRQSLVRSFIFYTEHYANDNFKQIPEWTEKDFTIELFDGFTFSSKYDRVVEFKDEYYIMDQKTSKKSIPLMVKDFDNDPQLMAYILAAHKMIDQKIAGVLVDCISVQKTVTNFGRIIIRPNEDHLNDYKRTLQDIAERYHKYHQQDYFPMNMMACGNFGGCAFKQFCTAPESVRSNLIEELTKANERRKENATT